jgi:hypothetical protein
MQKERKDGPEETNRWVLKLFATRMNKHRLEDN